MQLTQDQLDQFERDGYVFIPDLFSAEEIAVMKGEVPTLFAQDRPENVRERVSGKVRTNFAAHTYNDVYGKVSRHPRLIGPAQQLLGGPVYIHQFKINGKAAFDGDVWQWHQDYGTWQADDQMPEPRAMNFAVYLDEVNEYNGPLMLIPGSHRKGAIPAAHDLSTTSYPLWTLDKETVAKLANEGGMLAPKGKPGSVLLFHSNIVHASAPNISPWGRVIVYLSLCHVDNHIRQFNRPKWIAHRDFTAIECLPDDCLS